MAMRFKCTCGKALQIQEELLGKKVRCPQCQKVLNVPAAPTQNTGQSVAPLPDDNLPDFPQPAAPTQPVTAQFPTGNPISPGGQQTGQQANPEFGLPGQLPTGQPMQSPGAYPMHKQPPAKPKSKNGLIIGLIAGGVPLLVLLGIFASIALYSLIGSPSEPDSDRQTSNTPSISAIDYGSKPLSEEECMAEAQAFCEAIESGQHAVALKIIDFPEVFRRGSEGIDIPKGAYFKDDFIRSSMSENGIVGKLIDQVNSGGSIRPIRSHTTGNERRVWIRVESSELGANYTDLVFFRSPTGKAMIGDMYGVASGELVSRSMRTFLIGAVAATNPTLVQKISGADRDMIKHQQDINMMAGNVDSNPQATLEIFDRLPPSIQDVKIYQLVRVRAAGMVTEEAYSEAIADFRRKFPNDPSVDFYSIVYHANRGETQLALNCVDNVDKLIGGDPFLNSLRARIASIDESWEKAEEYARESVKHCNNIQNSHIRLTEILQGKGDYEALVEAMKIADTKFEIEWSDFEDDEEFRSSPHFQEWQEYLNSK